MRRALALLLLAPLAGCFHADDPPAERELAMWTIELSGGETQRQFEVVDTLAYWRVDLTARSQQSVSYVARAPDGTTFESEAGTEFPFTHRLRVDSPQTGAWDLTIRAGSIVEGSLRVLAPE